MKVILDTDIGSDIDDAVCLAWLLANPDCELLGITTVTGAGVERAALASVLCKVAGQEDMPIYPGVERPLLVEPRQSTAWQSAALAKWPHRTDFPEGGAVEFMRDIIRAHPGEVTLLAVGPLTNIALLFTLYPDIPGLLAGLVNMGGKFFGRTSSAPPCDWREWNLMLDPHAAAMVYRTPATTHRSVGMDVTCRVVMPAAEVRERFQVPLLRPVLDFAEIWFQARPEITFHDPLAAVTIFDSQVCRFDRGSVDIELDSPRLAGLTHWQPGGEDSPHEIAADVNVSRFFDFYFGMFTS